MAIASVPNTPTQVSSSEAHFSDATTTFLVDQLLREQGELSAVEAFANWEKNRDFQSSIYRSLMPARQPNPGEQYAFEVDLDSCSGCKSCVVACHNLNGLDERETWRKVGMISASNTQDSGTFSILQHATTACHHCVEPGCLLGCPVGAYEKDPSTGIVRHLDDQCFGCKYCTMMCPYEVPQYNTKLGIVRKCDMCTQRMLNDEAPACVQACPTHAIRITIVEQSSCSSSSGESPSNSYLLPTGPSSDITKPSTQFVTSKNWSNVSGLKSVESASDHSHDGHWPLAIMLALTQASVGLWGFVCITTLLKSGASSFTSIIALLISIGLCFIGLNAATLHLGRPWLAFRGILGWKTSWLSREAIAFGVYAGLSILSVFSHYIISVENGIVTCLIVTTTLVGGLAVSCSAMIYVATKRSLWNRTRSFIDYGLTTVGLGMIAGSCFANASVSVGLAGFAFLVLAFGIKVADFVKGLDACDPSLEARSGRVIRRELLGWFVGCCVLVTVGILCILISKILVENPYPKLVCSCIASGLAISAGVLNRFIYFASVVFPRIPGAST